MSDKSALITGAATGIGAEVARQLAAQGVKVAVCDVNSQAGSLLAQDIGGIFISCDVTDYGALDGAVDQCISQLGVPDLVHLNAGVMTVANDAPFLAIEDVSLEQYRRIMSVNLDGVFHGLKSLLPRMGESGGTITVTASIAGLGPLPIDPLYATTKFALIGLVRSVAAANADGKVRVNAICPGAVDTTIVPEALRAAGVETLPTSIMAAEILDLLANGGNGEIRVKLSDAPGFIVNPPDLQAPNTSG